MVERLLDKLSYANVVATIALIAGLSGGTSAPTLPSEFPPTASAPAS